MKILITGAGGFLGTELVKELMRQEDVDVVALTSQKEKLVQTIGEAANVTLSGRNSVFEPGFDFSSIDVLINCAFPRNVDGIQMADGLQYISRLLKRAVTGGVKSVINISSQSVYSQTRMKPAAEDTELNLESKYAIGKYAAELLTNSVCWNIPHTSIRMASLIGVGFDQRLVNKFIKQVLEGENICIRGGRQMFGFLDVRDAASAIIAVAQGKDWKEIYNLGPDRGYTLLEIAKCVQDTVKESGFENTEIELEETDDWQNSSLDSTRLKRQFDWREQCSLRNTVLSIIRES